MIARTMGEAALLLEFPDAPTTLEAYRRLRADAPPWIVELVPAAVTVLLVFDPSRAAPHTARVWVDQALTSPPGRAESGSAPLPGAPATAQTEIAVRYDGADLQEVSHLTGLTVDEVIAAHTGSVWTAAFIGFAPGFAYLVGDDRRLDVPRRSAPRPAVPAGSVALAAGYCGIYPRESPGGWHIIGTTDVVLWESSREQPALLAPGTRVRFRRG